ncbi:peptidoglycan bridge formation glycyltransferase FemA/FemB family protein [Candidatus Saccharibacteria bacterium]|nr:peptidoglycan bridge formation glycyltransferase FemA/FemB family protein [Candidatus Saccharibacteria bacterium]
MGKDITKKWQEILLAHPEANFLQSPEYGKMNELSGDKVIIDDFDGRGWALMIVREAKRGKYLEIPCGPLCDYEDETVVKGIFSRIAEIGRREKCVFVRVRPQIRATSENLALLKRLGLKVAPMHLAAEHTVMLDLTRPLDAILANMRRQTRYEVRRAEKLGITVTSGNSRADFEEFHAVQTDTAKRQNFVPPSLKVLLAEKEAFLDDIRIYKALSAENEPVAYGLVIRGGAEGDYYEAASTELNRKLPGAYALLWQAIQDLKEAGYQRFNLWGIAPAGQPNHRYAGVTTFKTGFGGEVVEFVPAHDLILSRTGYLKDYIVEFARKKRRHL